MSKLGFRGRLTLLAVLCGTLFQGTTTCTNNLSELAIREVTNVVTDTLFFMLDNAFVNLAT